VIRWLLVILAAISPAEATAPAQRAAVVLPAPPEPIPAADYDALLAVSWTDGRCTVTRIGPTTVTAAHCLNGATGWTVDGDLAWQGPPVNWVDPASIPRGATLYGVGHPAVTGRTPVAYALAAVGTRTVVVGNTTVLVLMALGEGVPCSQGASGFVAWVTIDGEARPVGTMSVYSTQQSVTGLPAGQYVCGFAIG
jgi:hypothetical protein